MDERRRQYLELLGVQIWERRPDRDLGADAPAVAARVPGSPPVLEPAAAAQSSDVEARLNGPVRGRGGETDVPAPSPVASADAGPYADLGWDELAERVRTCTACGLAAGRTQTVFGVGDPSAEWMLVGEAPGAEEDRQGFPFVGRAGQLLTAMLRAIGFARDQVYIANILKCRPPNNRDPKPEEVACCEGFLHRQVALVRPGIILCLGRIAAQNLLKVEAPLKAMRGRRHAYGPAHTPVVVTYHPAYLLRNPVDKRRAWEDLCFARRVLNESRERAPT